MRDQLFLATKPHVDFDIEDDSDEPMVGIAIKNAGPGPAVKSSIELSSLPLRSVSCVKVLDKCC
jgi:hypothetical protein